MRRRHAPRRGAVEPACRPSETADESGHSVTLESVVRSHVPFDTENRPEISAVHSVARWSVRRSEPAWHLCSSFMVGLGEDEGLTPGEIALNLASWPNIFFALAQTFLLFVVSFWFLLRRTSMAVLPATSLILGAYYYVMFFSYDCWGNDVEPWLDEHLKAFDPLVTVLFVIAYLLPYALAVVAGALLELRPSND